MTERKPPDMSFESWVERQIQEAVDRGEFDNLPGTGKPLPGAGGGSGIDEDWWLRGYLAREGVSSDALRPESLLLRKQIELLPETVRSLDTEEEVRAVVARVNGKVMEFWRSSAGPQVPVRLANADAVVEQWQAAQSAPPPAPPVAPARPAAAVRAPWWRRLFSGPASSR
jgi:hypothetical protein